MATETEPLLPIIENSDGAIIGVSDRPTPKHILKIALRIKELIDIIVPITFDQSVVTRPDSPVITERIMELVKQAAGGSGNGVSGTSSRKYRAALIFVLLTVKRWYDDSAQQQLFDAELYNLRTSAAEAIAQRLIETEDDERYLFRDMLCQRYSITIHGEDSEPANALELAVDLHSTAIISTSGYQRCIKWLWRGWITQSSEDPNEYVIYKDLGNTDFKVHFSPDRLKTPKYQNYVQLFFCFLYLLLFTLTINTLQRGGDFDIPEGLFFLFTIGGIVDDLIKFYHVGTNYIGFWNAFNDTMYFLVAISLFLRINALGHAPDSHARQTSLLAAYRILSCCAPFVWLRILLYLESLPFIGVMLVCLTQMINESAIFFVLLIIVSVGFLQAFIGLDATDGTINFLPNTINTMLLTIMASPDFDAFNGLASPYGQILYYIFAFFITTLLLNILIALFGSAYSRIYDNANSEYLALLAEKTLRFVRAPDSYVYVPPLNIIEILFVRIPFGAFTSSETFRLINHYIMYVFYWPILFVTSYLEVDTARRVTYNRMRGFDDDANERDQEWDLLDGYKNDIPGDENTESDSEGENAIRRRIRNSKKARQLHNNIRIETSEELEQMNNTIEYGDPEFQIDEKKWQQDVLHSAPRIEVGDKSGAGWQNYWLVKELSTLQKTVEKIETTIKKEFAEEEEEEEGEGEGEEEEDGIYITKSALSSIIKDAVKQALEESNGQKKLPSVALASLSESSTSSGATGSEPTTAHSPTSGGGGAPRKRNPSKKKKVRHSRH